MRRLATAMIATALLLTGCSGASEETPEPDATEEPSAAPEASAEDVAALEAVSVDGDLGAPPTLDFEQPFEIDGPVARVDVEGTGDELETGQSVVIQYVAVSGEDGSAFGSTWDEGVGPETITLGDPQIIGALTDVLTGQKLGVRILFAAPGGDAVEATETTQATEAYPATLMAIEVVEIAPSRASGEDVAPPEGLPLVTLDEAGAPSIEVPAGATEPTELVVQPLIKGEGAPLEAGQQITVHYRGWLWDGTEFDASWGSSPMSTPIGAGQLIPGWDEGLIGQTVGSQVLLVVPSDKGYGDEGQRQIPGGATLIFVVDILSAS